MKKKYLVFGLLAASSLYTFGQQADSVYRKKKVSKTAVEVVYAHYLQNGNHSAVTGGTGTEKLTVYAPSVTLRKQVDSFSNYTINTGVDIISSASTDNIDYVISSASKVDQRGYLSFDYNRLLNNKQLELGGSGHFSLESDYLSAGFGLSAIHTSKDRRRSFSASLDAYFDDLRWGRLSGERPLKLVYPLELRYNDWFKVHKRQSYNLALSFRQDINQRMTLAVFPGIAYQHGLLATPFHRVYFADSSVHVEQLPEHRLKIPLGIQLNTFIGDRYILRSYYRFYWDDFGMVAHTIELELPVNISPEVSLAPYFRFYSQTAADYFKPFQQQQLQEFYTSDYDLSAFNSYETGLEFLLNRLGNAKPTYFDKVGLRYTWYKRSDGLYAHTITFLTDIIFQRKQ